MLNDKPTNIQMSIKTTVLTAALLIAAGGNAFLYYKLHKVENEPRPVVTVVEREQPIVMRTEGGLLEVSSIKANETFSRGVIHTLAGLETVKTHSEITVPVVFRYQIQLAKEWKFLRRGNTVAVVAPAVKPSLPVGIDTAKLKAEAKGPLAAFHEKEELETLHRTISPVLAEHAIAPRYIALQRDAARQTVAEFVRKWVLKQPDWKSGEKVMVRVFFEDEPISALASEGFSPVALKEVVDK